MRLRVENGSFFYEKEKPVLKNINLEAETGEIVAVLGPNGAGKTTLLRCITGMLPWKEGRSFLDGKETSRMPYEKLWRKLAYVPQARGTVPDYTALEMVLLGRSGHLNPFAAPGRKDAEKAKRALRMLGIGHLQEKSCCEVSGGELQMIRLARALAAEPEILVLDEPEANLDFKNQLIIMESLTRLADEGITCIFNTHDPSHALQRASRSVFLFADGSYVFGKTKTVVTAENIRKAFGVEAAVGETAADGKVYQNVIPLHIADEQ